MAKKQQVCKIIEDYFKNNDYTYNINSNEETDVWDLVTGFKDSVNEEETVGMIISVYEDCVICTSIASKNFNKNKVDEISEFLMRVNDVLKRGCFIVDYDHNSEISLRMWASTKGKTTESDINYLVNVSLGSITLVLPWVSKISDGEISVRKAFSGYKEVVEQ